MTLTGSGFADWGGVFCRFGGLGERHLRWNTMDGVVPATLLSATQLLCLSPPGGLDDVGRAVDGGAGRGVMGRGP